MVAKGWLESYCWMMLMPVASGPRSANFESMRAAGIAVAFANAYVKSTPCRFTYGKAHVEPSRPSPVPAPTQEPNQASNTYGCVASACSLTWLMRMNGSCKPCSLSG
jgi:hypothetical protein